jgi:hypothetical protein
MESAPSYWFTSTRFSVEVGEEEETNPRMYGRQLARWLGEKFASLGYPVEEAIAEDWGWCVMCQREPYELRVGCVNLRDYACAQEGDRPPPQDMLLWNAVPMAERPFFRYLFRRKPSMTEGLSRLGSQLHSILEAEASIQLVDIGRRHMVCQAQQ